MTTSPDNQFIVSELSEWDLSSSLLSLPSYFILFVHTIDYIQNNTQTVQIQTQHAPALDWRDNKLIFCLLPHSHDIILYVLKQQMLLDGVVGVFFGQWFRMRV